MARLIPTLPVDDIPLKPERDVARALVEKLPNDCIVYHSYPWLRPERNDRDTTAVTPAPSPRLVGKFSASRLPPIQMRRKATFRNALSPRTPSPSERP